MQECTAHSYVPSRKKYRAWLGLLAATVLVTSGSAIPIGIGRVAERQAKPRSAEVVKRCERHDDRPADTRKNHATQAQADALLRWLL